MQPPATAATITVHLFFCAASCLSVSPLSAKPLRAEEHTENSCRAAIQTTVYVALARTDAFRILTYFRAALGLHRAWFTEALDVIVPRKLLSKCCILVHVIKKHLHKLCRDSNYCAGVLMTVKLNRLVVVAARAACAPTTCGASRCTLLLNWMQLFS